MPNLVLASYANVTLYVAMAALTVAMIAFAVYVAFSARPHLGAPGQAARERELVAAGAGLDTDTGGLVAVDPPQVHQVPGQQEHEGGRSESGGPKASRGSAWGRWAMTASWFGTFLLVLSVVLRGVAVHRPPVGNMFEFAVFGSMLVMLVYLGLSLRWPLRWLGLFVVLPVLLTLGLALTVWYTAAAELLPSLKSLWLAIHVPVATLSVAVFTIAFSVLVLHLLQAWREARLADGLEPAMWSRFLADLPSSAALDRTAYSLHVVAFPLWTFSLIAGAIWAQQAWGSYWNWDPKEVWTFIIWVIYAAYLHARATSGWSLRTANTLAVVGYLAIIVNFAVVNVYFIGQHSYSGLG